MVETVVIELIIPSVFVVEGGGGSLGVSLHIKKGGIGRGPFDVSA